MDRLVVGIGGDDHLLGAPAARITLVEFGDYECPFCARAGRAVHAVLARMGSALLYAYRHFPLVEVHPHALRAALAAEAAGAQGQFWPMHEILFAHQDALDDEDLLGYAGLLGIDLEQFASELDIEAHIDKVKDDLRAGVQSGVAGTPTFFVNGLRYEGRSEDVDALVAALQRTAPPAQGRAGP